MSRNSKDEKKLDRRGFLKLGTLLPVVGLGLPHLRAAESCQLSVPVFTSSARNSAKIHLRYGNMPNAVYVVDKKGNIVYKANWTDAPVVDEVLAELRAEEARTGTDNRQLTTDD